ncbi:MAG TPA: hypothetical protein GXZ37_03690 [Clostridiales bacterium]|nr:hypothetical protein [Clostridiales bacterium]
MRTCNVFKEKAMRRKAKMLLTAILIIAIAAIYFLFPKIKGRLTPDFCPVLSDMSIPFTQQEDIRFFAEGWIVCGSPSRFYNWDQTERKPPFTQDDLTAENNEINIIAHTDNYIATANNRIYNTQTVPFTLVYENQGAMIFDLKEYEDYLVLLLQEEDTTPACPFILVKGSDFLISLDGTGNANYVSVDAYGTDLSLLTLSLDSPVPITRVFHYKNRNELYGVLSLENEFIYEIYRMENTVILIGIKDILCYNVEGELQWSVPHESEGVFEVLPAGNELLFYFPEKSRIGENEGNVLVIDKEGYYMKTFPKYLSELNIYRSGYAAAEFRQNLVFLDKKGEMIKKQRLQHPVSWMKFSPVNPEYLYVRTESNVLQLYTSDKQEEDSE